MDIDVLTLDKLAELSKLHFNAAEKDALQENLRNMLQFVQKLNELDTVGVAPLIHITQEQNNYRSDLIEKAFSSEEALANAQHSITPFFTVPKVIKKQ
jgi:aspartyl-tRNA(Asn)/glutamyl-tRNA(Gln) amidotransferase subunit C